MSLRDLKRIARMAREAQRVAEDLQLAAAAIKTISNEAVDTFDHVVETSKKIKRKAMAQFGGKAEPVFIPNQAQSGRRSESVSRGPKRQPTRDAVEVRDADGNTLYVVK